MDLAIVVAIIADGPMSMQMVTFAHLEMGNLAKELEIKDFDGTMDHLTMEIKYQYRREPSQLITFFAKRGAFDWIVDILNVRGRSSRQNIPLNLKNAILNALEVKHLEIVKLLLNYRSRNDHVDIMNKILDIGDVDLLNFVLKCDSRIIGDGGYNFLLKATEMNRLDMIKILLHYKSIVCDDSLQRACQLGYLDIVAYFIQRGVKVKNAMYFAALNGHVHIINYLISTGNKDFLQGLRGAIRGGHIDIIILMLDLGGNKMEKCMSEAVIVGRIDTIELLVSRGGQIHPKHLGEAILMHDTLDVFNYLMTLNPHDFSHALIRFAGKGNLEMVKDMITRGATNLNEALTEAAIHGHFEVVKHLISCGANNFSAYEYLERQKVHRKIMVYLALQS